MVIEYFYRSGCNSGSVFYCFILEMGEICEGVKRVHGFFKVSLKSENHTINFNGIWLRVKVLPRRDKRLKLQKLRYVWPVFKVYKGFVVMLRR